MLKQQKTLNKILVYGIFALLVIGITTTIGNILISNNKIQAQKTTTTNRKNTIIDTT